MVYDCFTFFNELDLLEIRLNVLSGVADKFVLVEADRTFSNKKKPFYFDENKERYKKFFSKIIHIKIMEYPETKDAWDMEYYQRNQIARGLLGCSSDDVVLISDLDEIPNPTIITRYRKSGTGICKLKQVAFYYYLNYQKCITKYWNPAKIMRYKEIISNNYTPQKIRMENNCKTIRNAGWHFSYLGGMESIKYKIQSFVHQEFNNATYVNDDIENKVRLGLDLFYRCARYIPVKITNKTYPQYIVRNHEKYGHLIYSQINYSVVIKNTLYCIGHIIINFVKRIVVGIIKTILPKRVTNKLKEYLHKRANTA